MTKTKKKFNKIYKKGIIYKPLSSAFFDDYFPKLKGKALDFGCGRGQASVFLAKRGLKVDAIDFSTEALRKKTTYRNVSYVLGDEKILPALPKYDFILLKYVLAFIPSKKRLIKELMRHLKPGGKLLILTPVRRRNYNKHQKLISVDRKIFGIEPIYHEYGNNLEVWYVVL